MNTSIPESDISLSKEWSTPQLAAALRAARDGQSAARVIVSTTGSSGVPKKVVIGINALRASAAAAHKFLGAKPKQVWSLLLPTNHIAGVNVIMRSIELESELVDINGKADFTSIVPTQLHRALNGGDALLRHLQNTQAVLVGGAGASKNLLDGARAAQINVVTTYGMSETCGGCVYNDLPLDGVEVQISAEGLIMIKSPTLADGYLNNDDLWNNNFNGGWFTTSDLGTISDGKVTVLGRSDDVIMSGGESLSLNLVEAQLAKFLPNVECIAFAVPDEKWSNKLCIGSTAVIDEIEVSHLLVKNLGKQYSPKDFITLIEIPTIGIGKPDRVKAREIYLNKKQ